MIESFPKNISAKAPPIKTQGIKTKLVPFILASIKWDGSGRWIEPFVGSGAVVFNAAPRNALLGDTNKHLIDFYKALQNETVTSKIVRQYLEHEGSSLKKLGEDHFYEIRDRFNDKGSPLDFLFLSRACFNGVMRFNRRGKFNVPFCRKPDRFRPAYITKICNQVEWASNIIRSRNWEFVCQDWAETLKCGQDCDFAYVDPPYVGRHADYFNKWNDDAADFLAATLVKSKMGFAYSMWSKNQYRENGHLPKWFGNFHIAKISHFYHVGSSEELRHEMEEALVISPQNVARKSSVTVKDGMQQLSLI